MSDSRRIYRILPLLLLLTAAVSGCGLFARGEPTPTATAARALVPTFTPTAEQPAPPVAAATPVPAAPEPALPPTAAVAPTEEPTPTQTPPSTARLTVTNAAANVRRGPDTGFGLLGAVNQGQQFEVTGRNPAGDWLQFCCVNGERGWIFAALAQAENLESVAVVTDIPALPTSPPPPTPPPAPAAPPPAPPPATDPCAGIGGDGCKFKLTGGPRFAPNGGQELKLQLSFIHSGVDGGQPQGSYFVVVEKDGQRLPISDAVRSVALQSNQGNLGRFNYEYKIGSSQLPGNRVEGAYQIWVLDGNGERDSQTFGFNVPEGEGEVWIQFDQN